MFLRDIEKDIIDVKGKHCPQIECRFEGRVKEACMSSDGQLCEEVRQRMSDVFPKTEQEENVLMNRKRAHKINSIPFTPPEEMSEWFKRHLGML